MLIAGCLDAPPAGIGAIDAAVRLDAATSFTVSSRPDVPLPDQGGPVEDELEVQPVCAIAGITVDIEIEHAYRGDVVILLTSPTVRTVTLKDSSDGDDGDDVVGNYPLTLTPVDSLEAFSGLSATGTWTLTVEDVDKGTVGSLTGWALNLTCS
jgi:subtilisin-like proprotein convertase family protein